MSGRDPGSALALRRGPRRPARGAGHSAGTREALEAARTRRLGRRREPPAAASPCPCPVRFAGHARPPRPCASAPPRHRPLPAPPRRGVGSAAVAARPCPRDHNHTATVGSCPGGGSIRADDGAAPERREKSRVTTVLSAPSSASVRRTCRSAAETSRAQRRSMRRAVSNGLLGATRGLPSEVGQEADVDHQHRPAQPDGPTHRAPARRAAAGRTRRRGAASCRRRRPCRRRCRAGRGGPSPAHSPDSRAAVSPGREPGGAARRAARGRRRRPRREAPRALKPNRTSRNGAASARRSASRRSGPSSTSPASASGPPTSRQSGLSRLITPAAAMPM